MRELRDHAGVSVLIYDQTCATEKRRRRKRGAYPDPEAAARAHQRARVRGLRRLFGAVPLPVGRAAGDRVRPQARHQPVQLQQGFLLSEGLLPQLRDGGRRQAARPLAAGRRDRRRSPAVPVLRALMAYSSPAWAAPAWSPSASCWAWPRISRAGAVRCWTWRAWPRRRRVFARGAGRRAGSADEHARGDGRGGPGAGRRPGGGHQRRRHGAPVAGTHARAAQQRHRADRRLRQESRLDEPAWWRRGRSRRRLSGRHRRTGVRAPPRRWPS